MVEAMLATILAAAINYQNSPSLFKVGNIYYFERAVAGKFTSYGGKETAIKRSKPCKLKVLSIEKQTDRSTSIFYKLKFGAWDYPFKDEPNYVGDTIFIDDVEPTVFSMGYPIWKLSDRMDNLAKASLFLSVSTEDDLGRAGFGSEFFVEYGRVMSGTFRSWKHDLSPGGNVVIAKDPASNVTDISYYRGSRSSSPEWQYRLIGEVKKSGHDCWHFQAREFLDSGSAPSVEFLIRKSDGLIQEVYKKVTGSMEFDGIKGEGEIEFRISRLDQSPK